jgi:WD40 repeat protein
VLPSLSSALRPTPLPNHTSEWYALAWSPDGTVLVAGGEDAAVTQWDADTGEKIGVLPEIIYPVASLAWSPDGRWVAVSSRGALSVWETSTWTRLARREGFYETVVTLAWSPDSRLFASGHGDGSVQVWRPTLEPVMRLEGLSSPIPNMLSVSWSPDGSKIAAGAVDGIVRVWDVNSRSLMAWLVGHDRFAMGVSWSPDSLHLASAGRDGTLCIWNLETFTADLVLHPSDQDMTRQATC